MTYRQQVILFMSPSLTHYQQQAVDHFREEPKEVLKCFYLPELEESKGKLKSFAPSLGFGTCGREQATHK